MSDPANDCMLQARRLRAAAVRHSFTEAPREGQALNGE
jgi:hypothetical protein